MRTRTLVLTAPLPERFWAKVNKTDTCWLWTAQVVGGYGQFWLDRETGHCLAHRLTYAEVRGPIPEGLTIDHLRESGICTSKLCVRPEHLELVTHLENVQRYYRTVETCKRGHPLVPESDGSQRYCPTCRREQNREYRLRPGHLDHYNDLRRARRAQQRIFHVLQLEAEVSS